MLATTIIFLLIALLLNIYSFRGVKLISMRISNYKYKRNIKYFYWALDVLFIVFSIIWIVIIKSSNWHDYIKYSNYLYISGAFALIYFPRFIFAPFVLLHDLELLIKYTVRQLVNSKNIIYNSMAKPHQNFFSLHIGALAGIIVLFLVIHGVVIGKSNFKVNEVEVPFENLPESFDGLEIVHISDTHLGSFKNKEDVIKGIEIINNLDPDIILFTGDLINNEAKEGLPYIEYFNNLQPNLGKFSVLGNHDIGDYRRWYMIEEKDPDIKSIEKLHKKMGFELLRDQHVFVQKQKDSIMIAGVDNWGLSPFRKAGNISKALSPHNDYSFIILISHDPTHWVEEVLSKENISLTLSGHTHGMQFGIDTKNFTWSPASFKYRHWHGLYEDNDQLLYVNAGFGYVGLPLRIGIFPEITLIRLIVENSCYL